MEEHPLKDNASHLESTSTQGVASTVDLQRNCNAMVTECNIKLLRSDPENKAADHFSGRLSTAHNFVLVLAFALILLSPLAADQSPQTGEPDNQTTEPTEFAQRIYLDPKTGRLLSEPPLGAAVMALSPAELNMLSTSHSGLVEVPLPDGGYLLDIQGRFRNLAVATLAEDGTIVINEVGGEVFLPVEPDQSEEPGNDE